MKSETEIWNGLPKGTHSINDPTFSKKLPFQKTLSNLHQALFMEYAWKDSKWMH